VEGAPSRDEGVSGKLLSMVGQVDYRHCRSAKEMSLTSYRPDKGWNECKAHLQDGKISQPLP
jgi:hypothetical protein